MDPIDMFVDLTSLRGTGCFTSQEEAFLDEVDAFLDDFPPPLNTYMRGLVQRLYLKHKHRIE